MRGSVINQLREEVTAGHSLKQLKKEYKEMKRGTQDPKPKLSRRSKRLAKPGYGLKLHRSMKPARFFKKSGPTTNRARKYSKL